MVPPIPGGQPTAAASPPRLRQGESGFTLIEILSVVVIMALVAGMGLPKLQSIVQRAKVVRAIGDISAIQWDLMALESQNQPLPASLAGIGRGAMRDPWGYPYVYYPFPPANRGNPRGARRDRFLVPVNSTFDLYSVGPDGQSALPFTAAASHDDIVRANDGGFIGPASEF